MDFPYAHPLRQAPVVRAVERVASAHLGRRWRAVGFADLGDRASHPCGVLHGHPFSVFGKPVDGGNPFGGSFLGRVADALARYA